MKLLSMRLVVVASLAGLGALGVVSSNAGCGDSGGTGQAGAGGAPPRYADTFEIDQEMWSLSTYVDANYTNLGAASEPDSGVSLDGGVAPTFAWASDCGDPSPGCLRLTVTFTGFKQYVDPQINIAPPVDFMSMGHNYVRARIRLASGSFPSGGVQFHVSSGLTPPNDYVYASAPFINASMLVVGTWMPITLDTSTLTGSGGRVFDPSQIVQIGIQFTTGDPYEGGTPAWGQAVFEIDTVSG